MDTVSTGASSLHGNCIKLRSLEVTIVLLGNVLGCCRIDSGTV
jgi:hypothetical protein